MINCREKVGLVAIFIFLILVFMVGGSVIGLCVGIAGIRRGDDIWLAKGAAIGTSGGLLMGVITVTLIYICTVNRYLRRAPRGFALLRQRT